MRMLLLLLLTLAVYAGTPKIYSTVGDPVYGTVDAVETLSTYKTFQGDRELFLSFVRQADTAKEEGFWLDKYHLLPEAKARSKAYLKTLRKLKQLNAQISKIVKDATLDAIGKHHEKTYAAIKKSAHPVLKEDRELRQAMLRFERRLAGEHQQRQKEQAQKQADWLRSSENLKGAWRGTAADGDALVYRFSGKNRLVIVIQNTEQLQTLEGTWRIDSNMLRVALNRITNQRSDGVPHVRETDVRLSFEIRGIGKKSMDLFDTRRKSDVRLAR